MLRIFQFLWVLPVTILVWLFYILPIWLIFRGIEFIGWAEPFVAEFQLTRDGLVPPWYAKLWRDWGGWAGPCVFIRRRLVAATRLGRVRVHELTHVHQQFRWGIFFNVAYLGSSVWIWLFKKNQHSYYDNFFEVAARRAAGQTVVIDRKFWKDGVDDRWIWW